MVIENKKKQIMERLQTISNSISNGNEPKLKHSNVTNTNSSAIFVNENKEDDCNCFFTSCMRADILHKVTLFLAELLGTGLLVFLGCMGCVKNMLGPYPSHFDSAFGFGLIVMLIIQIFGCVSGAHLNPAVTAAALVYNMVTPIVALIYFVAQMLGAFLGYGLLKVLTPIDFNAGVGFCVTLPHTDLSLAQAFFIEFMLTSVLILVCCGVWDPRNAKHHDSVAIKFGLTISVLAMVGGPYTGASMNPARSFAPALWTLNFKHHWIYWIPQMIAGFLIALGYKYVFKREAPIEKPKAFEEFPLASGKA